MKKKVLVTGSTFPRFSGDSEPRFIYDLCKEYTKYFDVTALVPGAPGAQDHEEMEGIHVIRYPYFPVRSLETLCYPGAIAARIKEKKARVLLVPFLFGALFLWLLKNRKNYDYIHCNWIIPQGIIQCLFPEKYILTGHGGDVTSLNIGPMKAWKKRVIDRAYAMTVVSGEMKSYVEEHFGRKDAHIIPMGCSLDIFSPDKRNNDIFGTKDKPVILFVGRLAEKKGVRYLIEAMKGIDARLVIAGDGPLMQELRTLADSVDADIEFVGAKNSGELSVMYASCDVFCIPSVIAKDGDKDGTPVVLEEAMASGAAVVGSALAGIGEIIKEGENGLLAQPGDAEGLKRQINRLLNDRELREKCSLGAIETAKQYDIVRIGERYKELFETMEYSG